MIKSPFIRDILSNSTPLFVVEFSVNKFSKLHVSFVLKTTDSRALYSISHMRLDRLWLVLFHCPQNRGGDEVTRLLDKLSMITLCQFLLMSANSVNHLKHCFPTWKR